MGRLVSLTCCPEITGTGRKSRSAPSPEKGRKDPGSVALSVSSGKGRKAGTPFPLSLGEDMHLRNKAMNSVYYYHHGWKFRLADRFPIPDALEGARDAQGRTVTDPDYPDDTWEKVALPHTFNDGDLFSVPIEDGGSGQRRTVAFYRNTLAVPPEHRGKRAYLLFEGLRQSCHLYVNGHPAGL